VTRAGRPLRVLLVDDQHLVRAGFAMMLSVEDDLDVVGEAADGSQAVQRARALRPDVILMDVQMPVMDGIEATRRVVAENLGRVVILTTFDRDDYLFDALDAGASGFLIKNADPDQLIDAVRAAGHGHALLAPEVTLRVIERMTRATRPTPQQLPGPSPAGTAGGEDPRLQRLTAREREVLVLIGQGLSNAEIAAALVLGEATVKTHVSNCLAKLHVRDRVQAVVIAHESGLIPRKERPGGGGTGSRPGSPSGG
jgi:DNA-binding NarL/FixJ family response regulator